jgi:hypothetical protein
MLGFLCLSQLLLGSLGLWILFLGFFYLGSRAATFFFDPTAGGLLHGARWVLCLFTQFLCAVLIRSCGDEMLLRAVLKDSFTFCYHFWLMLLCVVLPPPSSIRSCGDEMLL